MDDLPRLGSSSDDIELWFVSRKKLLPYWPPMRMLLESARPNWQAFYDLEHFMLAFLEGRMQPWLVVVNDVPQLLVITEFNRYPKCRVCKINFIVGSEVGKALHQIIGIEQWARAQGARFMVLEGRSAWVRLLKPYGYERDGLRLKKDLSLGM